MTPPFQTSPRRTQEKPRKDHGEIESSQGRLKTVAKGNDWGIREMAGINGAGGHHRDLWRAVNGYSRVKRSRRTIARALKPGLRWCSFVGGRALEAINELAALRRRHPCGTRSRPNPCRGKLHSDPPKKRSGLLAFRFPDIGYNEERVEQPKSGPCPDRDHKSSDRVRLLGHCRSRSFQQRNQPLRFVRNLPLGTPFEGRIAE